VPVNLLLLAAAAAGESDRPTIFLVVGILAIALLVWGLVKKLLVLVLLFGAVAAVAGYFYFS
jgi:hypothetical protein